MIFVKKIDPQKFPNLFYSPFPLTLITEDQTLYYVFYVLLSSPNVWVTIIICVVISLVPDLIIKVYDKIRENQIIEYHFKRNVTKKCDDEKHGLKEKIKKSQIKPANFNLVHF